MLVGNLSTLKILYCPRMDMNTTVNWTGCRICRYGRKKKPLTELLDTMFAMEGRCNNTRRANSNERPKMLSS